MGNLQRIADLILLRFRFCVAQQMCFIRSEQAENSDYFNVFKGSFEMRFIDQFSKPPDSNFFIVIARCI